MRRVASRRLVVGLFAMNLMLGVLSVVVVAGSNSGGESAAAQSPPSDASQTTTPDASRSEDLDLLRQRQDDFESFVNFILWPLAIFLGFVAAGGLFGVVFSIRNEIRSGQTHALLVAGETAQQARTEALHSTLLDASEKTITLVNQTLELARDSTDRATKALSDRAQQLVREVGQEMSALIARVMMHERFDERFFKVMVEEPSNRRRLKQLSDRLSTVEGYLAFQEMELEPTARLVKGLALHLNQDDQGAVDQLEYAAEGLGVSLRVRLCAYYFIGYAHNNTGEYRAAATAFDTGSSRASDKDPLRIEFARMAAESRFFELVSAHLKGRNIVESVQQEIDTLIQLRGETLAESKANLNLTLGNIQLFMAREAGRTASLTDALAAFRGAGDGLWATFGQVEVASLAGADSSLIEGAPSVRDVESLIIEKIQTRGEPRSIALLHLATAMCRRWRNAGAAEVEVALRGVDDQLGKVDSDIRLYSLRLRSNVTREQYLEMDVQPLSLSVAKGADGKGA